MGPDHGEVRQPDEILSADEVARRQYDERISQAQGQYTERTDKAKQGLARRIFAPKVIAKSVGMFLLDSHSILTGYTLGDIIAGVNGALDLIAAHHQTDRDPEERAKLRLKGAANLGAALIPGVPASATTPAINAAIDVERNPKPK